MRKEKRLMPETFFEVDNFILYTIPDNFVVSVVKTIATGPNAGKPVAKDSSFHSSIQDAYRNVMGRAVHSTFPDFNEMFTRMDKIESKLDKILAFKYSIQG